MPERLYDPDEIKRRSYEIIDNNLDTKEAGPLETKLMKRIVHTTGDFKVAELLDVSDGMPGVLTTVFGTGLPIVTDVTMVESGLRRSLLDQIGIRTHCFVHSTEASERAKENEITRSAAGIDIAANRFDRFMLVVGNAPTALLRLLDHDRLNPETVPLVVGSPVGFVSVEQSKTELRRSEYTSITLGGNRGGSAVAATIVNGLMQYYRESEIN